MKSNDATLTWEAARQMGEAAKAYGVVTMSNEVIPSWEPAKQLLGHFKTAQAAGFREFRSYIDVVWQPKWKQTPFETDPLYENWRDAAFLSKRNEPEYSTYLAWLIENSATGIFSSHLFSANAAPLFKACAAADFAFPTPNHRQQYAAREERDYTDEADGWYQSDITVRWLKNGHTTQIEVKTGDPNLSKTLDHVGQTRKNHQHDKQSWDHFILIMDWQNGEWQEIYDRRLDKGIEIHTLLWSTVATALRRTLTDEHSSQERAQWRFAAYSFLGIIEQDLMGLPVLLNDSPDCFPDFSLGKKILLEATK